MFRRFWLGVITVITVSFGAASVSSAAGLSGHKAVYTIDLKSARSSSGVVGVTGGTVYEFADACNGWIIENKSYMVFSYAEGPRIETSWAFSAWESKDAKAFRFTVRHSRNGKIIDDIEGRISRAARGEGGVAQITRPEESEIPFPKGTQFPTEHMLTLLNAAKAGESVVRKVLFDGAGLDNPFDVNAVIGGVHQPHGIDAKGGEDFTKSPTWAVRLAFFPLPGQAAAPEYEMEVLYREDGVAEQILQDFGDFVLKADLHRIEKLPESGC